ncbi:transposase family protein [Sporosarcina limicola]|uniref:Transposase n=1 Tax=Sporosarcina limicola TaxID=34101 RepID=A0A927MMV1_9BACL|nr:transposase family protein [Sporosarcina limicola]MBE1556911.1 transposase [Sporosarcina limicola]
MNSHFTTLLLDLTELVISNVERILEDFFVHADPADRFQKCPHCLGEDVIHKGIAYQRTVRHLPAFGRRVFLCLPTIRLLCKPCGATFIFDYACVEPGKRYTKQFVASLPGHVVGATVKHAAKQTQPPATTVERVFKQWMEGECKQVQAVCTEQALESNQLVLGIDDFACASTIETEL